MFFGVCILPLRDWNTLSRSRTGHRDRSLYLTFEGLKQISTWSIWTTFTRLYLTFEGLKRGDDWRLRRCGWNVCILPLRDWNFETLDVLSSQGDTFVSYLWGIETKKQHGRSRAKNLFVSYLWGIETFRRIPLPAFQCRRFVSYLWGIETSFPHFFRFHWRSLYLTFEGLKPAWYLLSVKWPNDVCILPLRDWNTLRRHFQNLLGRRLYLTFEGLKLKSSR